MTYVTNIPEIDIATGFSDVDRTGDPGYYMRFLEDVRGVEEWLLLEFGTALAGPVS